MTVNYVAYWAHTFFGQADDPVITTVRVASASPDTDGRFHVELPDLAQDPIAGAPGNEGTFQFQARNRLTGDLMGRLVPTVARAKMGGRKVELSIGRDRILSVPVAAKNLYQWTRSQIGRRGGMRTALTVERLDLSKNRRGDNLVANRCIHHQVVE